VRGVVPLAPAVPRGALDDRPQEPAQLPAAGGLEPFVAGIVSPYNPKNRDTKSEFTWFYVQTGSGVAAAAPGAAQLTDDCYSMSLDVEQCSGSSSIISNCMQKVKMLTSWYPKKVDWTGLWSEGMTLMDKMMHSVEHHLPQSWQGAIRTTFLGAVKTFIQASADQNLAKTQLSQLN